MSRFAERNPELWALLERLSAIVLGSLAFWLFSLPVITLPVALVGLFAAMGGVFRPSGGDAISLFWGAFRRSFGRALLLGLINLVAGLILYVDIRFFWGMDGLVFQGVAILFGSVAALLLLVNLYAWALLAWYPQPLKGLVKRAFLLAAAHPLHAVAGWLVAGVILLLLSLLPGRLMALLPLLAPGLMGLTLAYAAWLPMRRYADEEQAG